MPDSSRLSTNSSGALRAICATKAAGYPYLGLAISQSRTSFQGTVHLRDYNFQSRYQREAIYKKAPPGCI